MKKHLRHIPNILSVIRLLMIPLFAVTYFDSTKNVYVAAGVYVLAWATDVLDGFLARRFRWISELGKILDPLADKLMQITVAICFSVTDRIFLLLAIPLVLKELCMLVGALIIIRKQKVVEPSHWYGKFASAFIFVVSVAVIIIRDNAVLNTVAAAAMLAVMLFALAMYYFHDFRGRYDLGLKRK